MLFLPLVEVLEPERVGSPDNVFVQWQHRKWPTDKDPLTDL